MNRTQAKPDKDTPNCCFSTPTLVRITAEEIFDALLSSLTHITHKKGAERITAMVALKEVRTGTLSLATVVS